MIYGFSNGFYRWSILVEVPTPEVLGQVLILILCLFFFRNRIFL
ncbi:hypothetical protein LEP1GSC137_3207 [Leptospira borgpetersenii str. Noumea 25]|nr:hypothetical protein LEP1GSC137_3207 [Leptospira borgpetersenii str. Noumea 25]